jgi:hypothetical protein
VLETVDRTERRINGGNRDASVFRPNIVNILQKELDLDSQEATENAVALNNYFADRALGSIKSRKMKEALGDYIEFVRVRKQ